jgi:hypothetical protein
MSNQPDAAIIRTLLRYDDNTGQFHWRINRTGGVKAGASAGTVMKDGYRCIKILDRFYYAHRLAWVYVNGRWPSKQLDHINGIRLDNRIANLREANHSENQQNLSVGRRTSKSGLLGVRAADDGRWRSSIMYQGRSVDLGTFDTKEEAHGAYLRKKTELHSFAPTPRAS